MGDVILESFERRTLHLGNEMVKASVTEKRATEGKRSLELRFPSKGGSVTLPLPKRSWTGREALKFDLYASAPVREIVAGIASVRHGRGNGRDFAGLTSSAGCMAGGIRGTLRSPWPAGAKPAVTR